MRFFCLSMMNSMTVLRSFALLRHHHVSSNRRRAVSLMMTTPTRTIVLVRRSDWKPPPPNKASPAAEPEKPWPRSVVIGFFTTMSVLIPYTTCWWLSSNHSVRDRLLPSDSVVLDWMRQHFGQVDTLAHSEPERYSLPPVYRFVDEPTLRLRERQLTIETNNSRTIAVTVNNSAHTLPASTLATVESLQKVTGDTSIATSIALSFPEEKEQEELSGDGTMEEEQTTILTELSKANDKEASELNIFSAWHYHQPPPETSNNTILDAQHELQSINDSIRSIQESIKQGAQMDDLEQELQKLNARKRRLQLQKWVPFL